MLRLAEVDAEALGRDGGIGTRYLLSVFGGALATLVIYFTVIVSLDRTGSLPPPPIANNVCVDEKLVYLRENAEIQPDLLVIGSSVAWRNFNGEPLVRQGFDRAPLNGGFCGLRANQFAFAARYLLHRFPATKDVVAIVSPQDFETCRANPAVFDPEDVDLFLSGQRSRYTYYLRYFDPVSLVRNALSIARQRGGMESFDALAMDRFGSAPLDTSQSRGLTYGAFPGFDDRCFAELHALASSLARAGRTMSVVITPIHPEWKRQHDPSGRIAAMFRTRLEVSLVGKGGRLWDADRELSMPGTAFIDAIHLRWSAARTFSEALATAVTPPGQPGVQSVVGVREEALGGRESMGRP